MLNLNRNNPHLKLSKTDPDIEAQIKQRAIVPDARFMYNVYRNSPTKFLRYATTEPGYARKQSTAAAYKWPIRE